jgi:hypothetical protein
MRKASASWSHSTIADLDRSDIPSRATPPSDWLAEKITLIRPIDSQTL